MTPEDGKRLIAMKDVAVENFEAGDWMELGALTGTMDYVRGHGRLLRSLSFKGKDYGGHAMDVLAAMVTRDGTNIEVRGFP